MKKRGIIYLTDKEDYAIAYYSDQTKKLTEDGKLLLHLFEDALCTKPKISTYTKQQTKVVKDISKLKKVGYAD